MQGAGPPAFVPDSSEVAAGVLVFLYLVQNLPRWLIHSYCWCLMDSVCFVAGGDICPGASSAAEGPSLSLETLMSQGNRGLFEGN